MLIILESEIFQITFPLLIQYKLRSSLELDLSQAGSTPNNISATFQSTKQAIYVHN